MAGPDASGKPQQEGAIDAITAAQASDWRVRLALAPDANYLYKDSPLLIHYLIS